MHANRDGSQLTKLAFSNSMATRFGPATWYVASICRKPLRKLRPDTLKSTRLDAWPEATSMLCMKLPSEMKLRSPSFVRRLPCDGSSKRCHLSAAAIRPSTATLKCLAPECLVPVSRPGELTVMAIVLNSSRQSPATRCRSRVMPSVLPWPSSCCMRSRMT